MPPKSKRRKLTACASAGDADGAAIQEDWKGWCEMESDPAFFNVMLRELGVKGVKIKEITALDELLQSSDHIHALIFLFEYRGNVWAQPELDCPAEVWFANQVAEYSCASVAMLNIVNNMPDVELGPQLESFREFTRGLKPMDRGYAINSFDFLRNTHNSFARELDRRMVDLNLKRTHEKVRKQARREGGKAQQAASADTGPRRSSRQPKPKQTYDDEDNDGSDDVVGEPGFHFVAYMPINGRLWKMDGMDSFPCDEGSLEGGREWLDLARCAVEQKMAGYGEAMIGFNLMAVVKDAHDEAERLLDAMQRPDEMATDESAKMGESSTTADQELGDRPIARHGTQQQAKDGPSPLSLLDMIDTERTDRRLDEQRASLRRHDYRKFFTAWVDALKENGDVEALVTAARTGV